MLTKFVSFARKAALGLALAAASSFAAAGTIHVSVDTSGFGTDTGYFDVMMSASGGVPLATATISNLTGFDTSSLVVDQSYGFDLVGNNYVLRNDTPNDLFSAVNFGGVLGFDLTFAGDYDPLTSYISHVLVSAFDSDYLPLGDFDPRSGALAEFTWTPAATQGGQGSSATVPEPGVWLLMAAGMIGMALSRRRHNAQ